MKRFLIVYATVAGHTERVAQFLKERLETRGATVSSRDALQISKHFSLKGYDTVIAIASIHTGKHEREMFRFVKTHLDELQNVSTVFLSVSLTQARVERSDTPEELRSKSAQDVQQMIDTFLAETAWQPSVVKAVAGDLAYSQYNTVLRPIVKQIAATAGSDTDTSRDYDYTDWKALEQLADELAARPAGSPRH